MYTVYVHMCSLLINVCTHIDPRLFPYKYNLKKRIETSSTSTLSQMSLLVVLYDLTFYWARTSLLAKGLLRPLPIPHHPWSLISINFVTGLPPSDNTTCNLTMMNQFYKSAYFNPKLLTANKTDCHLAPN